MELSEAGQRSLVPWVWSGMVFAAGLALMAVGPVVEQAGWIIWVLMPTVLTVLGAVVAAQRPGNRIAWLLMAIGLFPLFDASADARIGNEPGAPELLDHLAIYWDSIGMWVTLVIPTLLLLFWFPTGRFLTRRWTWAGWVAGMVSAIAIFVGLFSSEIGRFDGWAIDNPIGFLPFSGLDESGGIQVLLAAGLGSLLVGGFVALTVRYRMSGTIGRRQIRWVGFSLLLLVVVLSAMVVFDQWDSLVFVGLGFLSLVLVPVAVVVAITRFDPEAPRSHSHMRTETSRPGR